jgi:hypothetical protein
VSNAGKRKITQGAGVYFQRFASLLPQCLISPFIESYQ